MESVIQQLLAAESMLKAWIGTDNCKSFIDLVRNDAEHIPEYAQGATSEAVVAGLLLSIQTGAKTLQDHLNVPLTVVCKVEVASSPTLTLLPKEEADKNDTE